MTPRPHSLGPVRRKSVGMLVAAMTNDISSVRSLLASDPDSVNEVDVHKRTPLHIAASMGNLEIARLLVSADRLNLFAEDKFHRTVAESARLSGNNELIGLLHESVYGPTNPARILIFSKYR